MDWLSRETEGSGDHFSVTAHPIQVVQPRAVPVADPILDEAFREAATNEYADEGHIEIDSDAVVSHGDDDGAYVAAWVWVDRGDVPLCACGARNDDGEGFNGMCGSCADKAEEPETPETTQGSSRRSCPQKLRGFVDGLILNSQFLVIEGLCHIFMLC